MTKEIKKLIAEERWKRWHKEADGVFILGEAEGTKIDRPKAKEPTRTTLDAPEPTRLDAPQDDIANDPTYVPPKSDRGRRPVRPSDVPPESSASGDENPYVVRNAAGEVTELTDVGKAALKANTVWTNNVAQLLNFQAGKRLAAQLGQKLAAQTGLDPVAAEKIAAAVMKQTLEELDELASAEIESAFSGVLEPTRS